MLQLLLTDLRQQSAERVAARQAGAEQGVAVELERLDRYFASVLADKTDPDDVRTINALHERRRGEEMRRHQVMAIVHPLQLAEAHVLMQRVEWEIRSKRGVRAQFAAQRPIAGTASWILACPTCGRPPKELVVCVHEEGEDQSGHCACETCATRCSVCASDFCAEHGIARCRVDEQPACEQHARMCPSCRMVHCTVHEGVCADGEGEHPACSACLEACGSCGRIVCNRHAQQSRSDAPKGSRRLCAACVRLCEGGTNEPVAWTRWRSAELRPIGLHRAPGRGAPSTSRFSAPGICAERTVRAASSANNTARRACGAGGGLRGGRGERLSVCGETSCPQHLAACGHAASTPSRAATCGSFYCFLRHSVGIEPRTPTISPRLSWRLAGPSEIRQLTCLPDECVRQVVPGNERRSNDFSVRTKHRTRRHPDPESLDVAVIPDERRAPVVQ